jgi:hypothetical protein
VYAFNMSYLHFCTRIDKLPDDIILYLNKEYNIVKVNNYYVCVSKLKSTDVRYEVLYTLFTTPLNNLKYKRKILIVDNRIVYIIKEQRDYLHFYKWIYLNNGDIIYQRDIYYDSKEICVFPFHTYKGIPLHA